MGIDEFIDDCVREEERHADRCAIDPEYCIAYIQSWGEQFDIFLYCNTLTGLNASELESLIKYLEEAVIGCVNGTIRVAVINLIAHAKKRLGDTSAVKTKNQVKTQDSILFDDLDNFAEAVRTLTDKDTTLPM